MTSSSIAFNLHAEDGPEYVLCRDYAASARLNLQHSQYTKAVGYLLHPEILAALPQDATIADIATGTGIWLLDLADQIPETCKLEGWDISGDQFPSKATLPENISFGTFDATAVLEEHMVERYDAVHVGLLALVVRNGDPGSWLDNLGKMLKPGGYLQWMEGDVPRFLQRIRDNPSSATDFPAMHAFEKMSMAQMDTSEAIKSSGWITDLGHHFGQHEFTDVRNLDYDVPRKYWRTWTETLLLIGEEMADQLGNEELKTLIKRVGAELARGAVNPTLFPTVVIGKKLG